MCKNRLKHYAARQTITFNINKITKYERPAAECPWTPHFYISERVEMRPPPRDRDLFFNFTEAQRVLLLRRLCDGALRVMGAVVS